jgi:hypothetical protein
MQRVPEQEFLHLVAVEEEAHHLQETLRRLERSETVIGFRDSYAEGPLTDVDAGAASRVEWYKRICPDLTDAPREDSDLWEQVYASPAKVMLWHGPIPAERIFASARAGTSVTTRSACTKSRSPRPVVFGEGAARGRRSMTRWASSVRTGSLRRGRVEPR